MRHGSPTAATLAGKLGCTVAGQDTGGQNAYDTQEYVDASCPASLGDSDVAIITFPSQGKENDWLHQNEIAEESTPLGGGYFEMVVGPLWVVGDVAGAASPLDSSIVRVLGGKETTF